jgi:hypothetical protein
VNLQTTLTPEEFRSWRVSVRNLLDHQRRGSRWWRGVSLYCWLGQDRRVRGVVNLDAITSEEFTEAFARWEPSLRRIAGEELADEVYAVMRPGVIAEPTGRGYQSVRLTIRATVRMTRPASPSMPTVILPMPVLL